MDALILIVGDRQFLETIANRIQNFADFTVEVAPSPREAMPLIQAQQPDLLLLQASQTGSLELCHYIKEQTRLAWIYCILLADLASLLGGDPLGYGSRAATITAEALEAGADACLIGEWGVATSATSNVLTLHQNQLLQAQLHAGLRMVRNHRELMRANDLLSAIALSDPLTELNNRRALEWELPRQIQNSRTRSVPLSIVMLDVDFFKVINDTHGHLVGDRVLQLLSARLRHNLRFYDTPFRYGGEEFVIILANTDAQEASMIAQRICRLISDQAFNVDESLEISVTISAGTASLTSDDDPKGINLLHRADQNLLRAKNEGRNRVVSCYDPPPKTLTPDISKPGT